MEHAHFDELCSGRNAQLIVLCGRRKCGKSKVLRNLMQHFHKMGVRKTMVFSSVEEYIHEFEEHVPSSCIFPKYDDNVCAQCIQEQQNRVDVFEQGVTTDVDYRMLMVFNDVFFTETWHTNSALQYLFEHYQRLKIIVVFVFQYPMRIPEPVCRQIDLCFLFRESVRPLHLMYLLYARDFFSNEKAFLAAIAHLQNRYDNIVLHTSLQKRAFVYNADWMHQTPFRLGEKCDWWTGYNDIDISISY